MNTYSIVRHTPFRQHRIQMLSTDSDNFSLCYSQPIPTGGKRLDRLHYHYGSLISVENFLGKEGLTQDILGTPSFQANWCFEQ